MIDKSYLALIRFMASKRTSCRQLANERRRSSLTARISQNPIRFRRAVVALLCFRRPLESSRTHGSMRARTGNPNRPSRFNLLFLVNAHTSHRLKLDPGDVNAEFFEGSNG